MLVRDKYHCWLPQNSLAVHFFGLNENEITGGMKLFLSGGRLLQFRPHSNSPGNYAEILLRKLTDTYLLLSPEFP